MKDKKSGIMTVLALIALVIAGWMIKGQLDKLPYETTEDKIIHWIVWTAFAAFSIICLALLSTPKARRGRRR